MFQPWFIDWANLQLQRIHDLQLKRNPPVDNKSLEKDVSDAIEAVDESIMKVSDDDHDLTMSDESQDDNNTVGNDMKELFDNLVPDAGNEAQEDKSFQTDNGLPKHFVTSIWDFFTPPLNPPNALSASQISQAS
jgi:hypothetical protein